MSFSNSKDKSVVAVYKLVKAPIYSHCFSQDKSILAVTCETDCLVYRVSNNTPPVLFTTLKDHDKTITAVDISIHGRIVTCSQDRNAYVWEPLSDGTYKPTLVLLRINRAATSVTWAPNGYKFAVGSSARIIAVCYYEHENNWWVSKHIKKPIKSTINCLSWHANGVLLAAGGTDGFMRVFSGFIKGLDSKESVAGSPWGQKFPFGCLIREWYQGSYIHDVEWRSQMERIAYVAHDGTLNVVDYQSPVQSVNAPEGLPYRSLVWINDHEIVCGGYSCHPVLFSEASEGWKFAKNLDKSDNNKSSALTASGNTDELSGNNDESSTFGISALRKFKELDLKGKVSTDVQESAHENAIVELRPFAESNGQITKVSSCGLDGKIVIYTI
ncbi:AAB_G0004420.mRNA.1.CDS.1 [Saccharomyces cerevisiae]|nr:AAB_G0004420.mRNA.1.CDS.1 [Saccharomyces cerevisiae]